MGDFWEMPAYWIAEEGAKYIIVRPNGTTVNGWTFDNRKAAKAYLDRLKAMGYCK